MLTTTNKAFEIFHLRIRLHVLSQNVPPRIVFYCLWTTRKLGMRLSFLLPCEIGVGYLSKTCIWSKFFLRCVVAVKQQGGCNGMASAISVQLGSCDKVRSKKSARKKLIRGSHLDGRKIEN